ncbi:serine/threonine-protein kinase [Desulfatirhabdium butyrativorans]|uniref:serine/threonine-protein kinase n=1 Tax=Desulfatirhabdium butyrativorans TaxID=340467 RepID=UPI0004099FA2|nr:serine/threonine-protein kinase [Desulfatirhabdium butyrativorans]
MEARNVACPNCFFEKANERRECSLCGYDENDFRSPAALPLRTVLHNQYLVGRVLGSPGGFGITYLCKDTKLSTRVAIKEFMPRDNAVRASDRLTVIAHSGKDEEFFKYGLKAFLAEAQTVAGFDHPNIVRVKNYFEENNTAYLVMDYYEGVSLAEYVKQKNGMIPEKTALGIISFILSGLKHVHEKGYLHRDVKPANIYLTRQNQIILLDFGAARYAMGEHSRSLSVVVTPGFSPFEQYRSSGNQGPWTDIYAIAATMYFMLSGKVPDAATDRIEEDNLIPLSNLVPGLSPAISEAVQVAMRVKACDRPKDVVTWSKMLRGEIDSYLPKTEQPRSLLTEIKQMPNTPITPHIEIGINRWKILGFGAGTLLILLVAFLFFDRSAMLTVNINPKEAEVIVDGKYRGHGTIHMEKVRPGKVTVQAMLTGYGSEERTIELSAGEKKELLIQLPAMKEAAGIKDGQASKTQQKEVPRENRTIEMKDGASKQPSEMANKISVTAGVKNTNGISVTVGKILMNDSLKTFLIYWRISNDTAQIIQMSVDGYAVLDGKQYEDSKTEHITLMPHAVSEKAKLRIAIDNPNKLLDSSNIQLVAILKQIDNKGYVTFLGSATMHYRKDELKQYLVQN